MKKKKIKIPTETHVDPKQKRMHAENIGHLEIMKGHY